MPGGTGEHSLPMVALFPRAGRRAAEWLAGDHLCCMLLHRARCRLLHRARCGLLQVVSLEGWTDIMYAFEETDGKCVQRRHNLRPSVDTWRPLAGVLRHLARNCVRRCRVSRRRVPARWASRLYFVCIVFIGAFVIVSSRREATPCAQARALCSSPTLGCAGESLLGRDHIVLHEGAYGSKATPPGCYTSRLTAALYGTPVVA